MLLMRCCGSSQWVTRMLTQRPFGSDENLLTAARTVWFELEPADWLEAFAAHPRIGERQETTATLGNDRERSRTIGNGGELGAHGVDTSDLSAREQGQVADADAAVRAAIARGNREYEAKFGYIFIICASGRPAESILTALRERLQHSAVDELPIAAAEQARITALRLQALA